MKKRTVKMNQNYQSKAEKEITDKKFAVTTTVTWPWVLHGLETNIGRFHCALFGGGASSTAVVWQS
jgi:hypothetical protein